MDTDPLSDIVNPPIVVELIGGPRDGDHLEAPFGRRRITVDGVVWAIDRYSRDDGIYPAYPTDEDPWQP